MGMLELENVFFLAEPDDLLNENSQRY